MKRISSTRICLKQLLLLLCCSMLSFIFSFAQNPIITENQLAGNPFSEWGLPDDPNVFKDVRIAGFATQISVNSGTTVSFKINVQEANPGVPATYTMKIYRIGYYGGSGARLVADLNPVLPFTGTVQPAPISDAITGLVDCGNWSVSATWDVPASAVSGLYIAKLVRTGGGSNHIVFIVRNDVVLPATSGSDILLQFPDATWQAYNMYGGNSFYYGTTQFPVGHAVKVSYNRPFFIGLNSADGGDWYMNNEYPMIRWLERNGYDVTYTSSIDVASTPAQLLYHKIFISLGHDEYWSKEQRDNVTAARNAGVHLAFFSGNEIYWKTRWEDNHRTLVCYKEGFLEGGSTDENVCGYKCDPSPSWIWTGLWRVGSGQYGTAPGGDNYLGKPENELSGQISWSGTSGAIQVPSAYKKLRFWRNTSIAGLATGQTATLAPKSLGYEWDWEQHADSYPSGRMTMSSTVLNNHTHKLSLYRHSSGALVFGAGTVQWSWGLDNEHYENGASAVSPDMQQATVNLFADMDVQPGSLQSGLIPATKSTDIIAPTSANLSLSNSQPITTGTTVTFAGDATDAGGGVVAGVEVSTDGGTTWHVANNSNIDATTTWNYSLKLPSTQDSIQNPIHILSRGFDDSGNMGNPETDTKVAIAVTLQGRTNVLPNAVWQVPLQINFYTPGNNSTPVYTFNNVTTNSYGYVMLNIAPGTYNITVKNNHSLKRVKINQTITAGYNLMIFNTLMEGDVNGDNSVNLLDFSSLLTRYNNTPAGTNTDFNDDGKVDLLDFSMLISHYNQSGEELP